MCICDAYALSPDADKPYRFIDMLLLLNRTESVYTRVLIYPRSVYSSFFYIVTAFAQRLLTAYFKTLLSVRVIAPI